MLLELKNHSGHVSLNVCLMCPLRPYVQYSVLYPIIIVIHLFTGTHSTEWLCVVFAILVGR